MSESRPGLVRAIGRWGLTAVVINTVIGTGVFVLPSTIARHAGAWSPATVIAAGAAIFVIVLCFAEVGSRFDSSGGPYLYVREAIGPAVGFQVGWMHVWTRIFTGAAILNVLVTYLATLVPWCGSPAGRIVTMTAGTSIVTAINVAGVRQASWTVNLFTVAKLLPLFAVIAVGLLSFSSEVAATQTVAEPGWTEALLLLVFAYGGFESAVTAQGENRDPKRDTAFAVIVAMLLITLIYFLVQLAVVGGLPNAAASDAPVAALLERVFGPAGATLGSVAVVISVYGWLASFALMTPRILFSMAERGELPAFLAKVHERFRTPYAAIIVNAVVALALGLFSTFGNLATTSAITRLFVFGFTCAALMFLRKRLGPAPGFRVPAGNVAAVLGVAFCVWLVSTRPLTQAWYLPVIAGAGAVVWFLMRGYRAAPGRSVS